MNIDLRAQALAQLKLIQLKKALGMSYPRLVALAVDRLYADWQEGKLPRSR